MSAISRRPFLAGAVAALGIAAAAGGAYELGLFRKRYASYGDLLDTLDDPDTAKRVGDAALAEMPDFDAAQIARDLRARISAKSLGEVLAEDIQAGHIVEAGGWVLPQTLAQLCALAAKQN